jgi:predicted DsbA family dithiol-disulfide isomerase
LRPAAEGDAPPFRPWATEAGPPTHSIPPHLAAKAAAALGPDAFRALRPRLFRAYFEENRDITARATLEALWSEAGLAAAAFAAVDDPALEDAVLADHQAALAHGVTGVPSVMLAGTDVPMLGALSYEHYRRWVTRALERA